MSQGMLPVGDALEQLLMEENNPEEFKRRKAEEERERAARKLREQKALEEEAARKEQERKQKWEEEERRASERREADRREKEERERAAREREAAEAAEAAEAPSSPPREGGASQSQGMDFGATQDLIPTQAVGRKGEVGGGGGSLNSQGAGSAADTQLSRKRSRTPSPPPPVQSTEEVEAPPAKKPKISPKPQQPKPEKAELFRAPGRKRKSKMPPHPYVVVEQARREMAEENKRLLMEQYGEEVAGMDSTEFEIWFDQTQSTMGIPLTIASQRGAAAEPDSASRVAGWLGSGEPGFRDNLPEKEVRAQLQKDLRERTGDKEPEAVDPTPPAAMRTPTLNGQALTYLNLTREQHEKLAKIDREAGKAYNDYFEKKRALAIDPKDARKPLGTFPLHAIKDGKAFGYVMGSGTKDPKRDTAETTPLKEKPGAAEAEDVLGSVLKSAPAVKKEKKNKKRRAPGAHSQNNERFE